MRKIRFTKQGFEDLRVEYETLKKNRVPAVNELQRAREMGDLSENAAYKVARSKLSGIDSRIRRLEKVLRFAVVVDKNENGTIDIGSTVNIDDGIETKEIMLVDGYESDFMKGKISVYSPIGKSLRGKRIGDAISVITPKGVQKYRIDSVS